MATDVVCTEDVAGSGNLKLQAQCLVVIFCVAASEIDALCKSYDGQLFLTAILTEQDRKLSSVRTEHFALT